MVMPAIDDATAARSITILGSTGSVGCNTISLIEADRDRIRFRGDPPAAGDVRIVDERLYVDLEDGQTVSVPVEIYPRLANGTDEQRANWRLIHSGRGIHWPDLDENIDTRALLSGTRPSEAH